MQPYTPQWVGTPGFSGAGPNTSTRGKSQTDIHKSHKQPHPSESPAPSGNSEDEVCTIVSERERRELLSEVESSSDSESDEDGELTGSPA